MSRLKIADLSFCETELENSGKIKGGMSSTISFSYFFPSLSRFLLPIEGSDVEVLEESVGKDGEKIRYFYDEELDGYGVEISKQNPSGKMISRVLTGNASNGSYQRISALVSS